MVSRPQSSQGNLGPKNKHFESASLTFKSNPPLMAQVDHDGDTSITEKECSTNRSSLFGSEDGKVVHSKPWR